MFTFDNSLAKGRKMTADLSKLMLRAYNAEADNSVRSLRAGNIVTAKKRLEASGPPSPSSAHDGDARQPDYHALRVEEIELTADCMMKSGGEGSRPGGTGAAPGGRTVEQELAAERERLDKERAHLATRSPPSGTGDDGPPQSSRRLREIDDAIEQNDYRAANIRAGYVYVICNQGAFGPSVVKIGMTRRLEPLDRVRELGGASVPFRFDVHALYFSEDAITLENACTSVRGRALNQANRREGVLLRQPCRGPRRPRREGRKPVGVHGTCRGDGVPAVGGVVAGPAARPEVTPVHAAHDASGLLKEMCEPTDASQGWCLLPGPACSREGAAMPHETTRPLTRGCPAEVGRAAGRPGTRPVGAAGEDRARPAPCRVALGGCG